jgi:hypothetical protein
MVKYPQQASRQSKEKLKAMILQEPSFVQIHMQKSESHSALWIYLVQYQCQTKEIRINENTAKALLIPSLKLQIGS